VRFIALLMLAEPMSLDQAASLVGRSVKVIENWGHQYLIQGIDRLNAFNYPPKKMFLKAAQIDQLVTWVKTTNPSKTKHVRAYITEQFQVS